MTLGALAAAAVNSFAPSAQVVQHNVQFAPLQIQQTAPSADIAAEVLTGFHSAVAMIAQAALFQSAKSWWFSRSLLAKCAITAGVYYAVRHLLTQSDKDKTTVVHIYIDGQRQIKFPPL